MSPAKKKAPVKKAPAKAVAPQSLRDVDWQDVGLRAGKTFVQAFVAAIVLPVTDVWNFASWKAAVLAAGAAAASAAWNGVIKPLTEKAKAKVKAR